MGRCNAAQGALLWAASLWCSRSFTHQNPVGSERLGLICSGAGLWYNF